MTKEVKNTLLMTGFALIFGLILGLVHEVTAGPIAEQHEKALNEAYQAVVPDAKSFNDLGATPEGAKEVIGDEKARIAQFFVKSGIIRSRTARACASLACMKMCLVKIQCAHSENFPHSQPTFLTFSTSISTSTREVSSV